MADNGKVKEEQRTTTPLDVMVATFADRQAARDAYQTLRSMDKEGRLALDGAVVFDRDQQGRVRLQGAMFPAWIWAVIAVAATVAFGLFGLVMFGVIRGVRGAARRMSAMGGGQGGERYTESREQGMTRTGSETYGAHVTMD